MVNRNLNEARRNKNDEFYTQLKDIENELQHYKNHFKDKVVHCNADNPKHSQFWRYFYDNFHELGLKKLTATYYDNNAEAFDYDGERTIKTPLEQNGDFRSPEAIGILKEADIVVTNPPFSLFRGYIAQLIEYDKSFIVIGNMNAITYSEIFPLLRDGKIWLGQNNGVMEFVIPENSPEKSGQRIDENGIKYQKFGNIAWYTNMNAPRRNEEIILYETYSDEKHPKYNDYDIINVDQVAQIPQDYEGIMGVPITFLTKHNPNQFKILGLANSARWLEHECITIINDRKVYNRVLIQRKSDDCSVLREQLRNDCVRSKE